MKSKIKAYTPFVIIIVSLFLFFSAPSVSFAQSPYYSVSFSIAKDPSDKSAYEYTHMLCEPKQYSTDGEIFAHDTSRLDWSSLTKQDLDSFECRELGSENVFGFKFGNQMMIYENIISLMIVKKNTDVSDTMRIVFPVRRKSFVSFLKLPNIPFQKGIFEIDDGIQYEYKGSGVQITLKDDYQWRSVEKSNLIKETY